MTRAEFQKLHSASWDRIIIDPAFLAALNVVEIESTVFQVIGKTDEDVKEHGPQFIARQQGFLAFSNGLRNLAIPREELQELGEEEYPDPLDELREELNKPKKNKKR